MLEFTLEEYANRIKNLLIKMEEEALDAVIITTAENNRYFSGLRSIVWLSKISNPGVMIITKDGKMALIGTASAVGTMTETTCFEEEDIYYYGRKGEIGIPQSCVEAISEVLKKFKVEQKRIGMELGEVFRVHMPQFMFQELTDKLPDAAIVDAARVFWELRTVKSEREIHCVRKVCEINDICYEKAFSSIEPGKTTERDLYRTMAKEAYRLGCDDMLMMGIIFGRNETNSPPSDKVISSEDKNKLLLIDGGPSYKGYYGDIIREAVVEGLTPKQQYIHDVTYEALQMVLGSIKEGVYARELSLMLDKFIAAKGLEHVHQTKGWLGHGIGLDVHEPPQIAGNSDYILKSGMTLSIEPLINDPDYGVFCNEQNILVTKEGYELLSKITTDMRVI